MSKKKKEKENPMAEEQLNPTQAQKTDNQAEELDELSKTLAQLDQIKAQLDEEKNQYLRVYAEFENFRRRSAKERIELIGTASSELMKDLLPILDDFERAIESNKKIVDLESVKLGFEILFQKLMRILNSKGLQPVASKGEMFDAEHHEAIAQITAANDEEKGKILDVAEKGYKLNDKVIRHPKVVVGS